MEEPKLKRIVFNEAIYLATTKDGIIFGDRTANGAHTTMLFKEDRLTIHQTDSGAYRNIFAEDAKDTARKLAATMNELVYSTLSKKAPQYVHPISLESIFEITVRGRTAYCDVRSSQDYILPLVTFNDFMDSGFRWGISDNEELLIKGRRGLYILSEQEMGLLSEGMRKIAFFKALDAGMAQI